MLIFTPKAGAVPKGKDSWLLISLGLFLTTFFIPGAPVVNNLAIVLLAICCFAYNSFKEKISLLKERPAIIFIIIFFLLQVLSVFLSDDTKRGLTYLQVRIPLLLFPISLGLIYITESIKLRALLLFAGIITLASVFCLSSSLITYQRTGDAGFLYNDSLTDAIGKQSVYFALLVNIAIFSFAYLLIKQYLSRKAIRFAIAAIGFLMVIHFMLASRMEIIFLYSTAIAFTLYYFFVRKKDRKKGFVMIGAMAVCAVVFVMMFPKTVNRFNELMYPKYNMQSDAVESHYNMELTSEQWNGLNIRLAIWKCAWPLIQANPLIGTGLGDKDSALQQQFAANQFKFGIKTNKNMHSTYLDVLSSMGIIGLLVFLAGFVILPMRGSIQARDVLGVLVLIDFMLSFVTETYPDRSMGNVLFGFFIAFTICYKKRNHLVEADPELVPQRGNAKIVHLGTRKIISR